MKTMNTNPIHYITLSLSIIIILASTSSVEAYSISAGRWQSNTVTYKIDASFSAYGSGWLNSLNTAVNDWNAVNPSTFILSQNSGSGNSIQAASAGGNLAVTPISLDNGGHFTTFTMKIDPSQPYYDGT